jgi:hypothetical protein
MPWGSMTPVSEDDALELISTERLAYLMDGTAMAPRNLLHCFRIYRCARLRERFANIGSLLTWLARCRYQRDHVLFDRPDVWLHPEDFERTRIGDCEDHALLAWLHLLHLGYDAFFVVGTLDGGGHAWTAYESSGLRLLEATAKAPDYVPTRLGRDPRYVERWAVDGDLRFYAATRPRLTVPIGASRM